MTEIPHLQKRECKDIRGIGSDTMLTLFDATKCTRYKHKGQHTTKIKRTKTYKKMSKINICLYQCTRSVCGIHGFTLLPRDGMRKRGLCCRPVSVCLSVCPSRLYIISRWLKISSHFFLGPVAPSF